MKGKNKFTNKQTAAMGLEREDNGQNLYEQERKAKQRKHDNVKPV
ncbi:hypothetical protein N4T77_11130 [Clostridium sp. CX1]|uniref:Small acid-soluble spore protein O n=1 Tax=Clostridium tanneri TaxID=3037988 RepID=A0ABU4JP50_9CLOT|nr:MULTISPECIES: hypothetical protein [unclassified Clostridium]MCT8977156.1 hypothetical protein [Clostridium sp. CX1]MDW8799900.1 hypothetical protein [Clostridium sp. A1-XYC3]